MNESIGSIIKSKRESQGWTQADLAEKTDCSIKTISKIENNHNTCSSIFIKVLKVLELKIM